MLGSELQAAAVAVMMKLQAVKLASFAAFIAITDAAHAAPQAVAAATELYCVNSGDCTGPLQWFVAFMTQTCASQLVKKINKA